MDPVIEFVQEQPTPLAFVLGPKSAYEYLSKVYEDATFPRKIP